MSSNTSKGIGVKGSKYWMQTIVNSELKTKLDKQMGLDPIKWLSPLAEDNYAEYKLNQAVIANEIGIPKDIYTFWPKNQPQWDAIGLSGDTIILVEAKAHTKELYSSMSASSDASRELICESMEKVLNECYPKGEIEKWKHGYYQLGNRLTFLKMLSDIAAPYGKNVKLVLLNIVNDITHKPTSEAEWIADYETVFTSMTGSTIPPKDVIVINFVIEEMEKWLG